MKKSIFLCGALVLMACLSGCASSIEAAGQSVNEFTSAGCTGAISHSSTLTTGISGVPSVSSTTTFTGSCSPANAKAVTPAVVAATP